MDERLYELFFKIEETHWWFVARRAILIKYLRHRIGGKGLTLLDVGCGTGAVLAEASSHFTAYGMDSSELAIGLCRKRGLTNLYVGTLKEYPASRKFDVILLLDVIEHIDDDLDVLQQALARLHESGHVLITVPAYQWLWSSHDVVNHHKRRYTRTRLKTVVSSAGFHVNHLTYFNTLLFPLALLWRVFARLTNKQQTDDFAIPSHPINAVLTAIFRLEQYVLPYAPLPFGLSVLCWATKPRT
jgi:SAM-dependent methyltransferase